MIFLVHLFAFALMFGIVWWFWGSHSRVPVGKVVSEVTIVVQEGVYQPDVIYAKKGQPISLAFLRQDPSPCAGVVVFPDFNLSRELVLNQSVEIILTPEISGKFLFTCQMAMYRGTLVVLA